ncbi:restriction endonuclease subunit S [Planococcus salinarum]|uniref:restriction endonuclease subunit S n=1 Tax=Planococcus salinarum TaxID=622695 RepID=UPI000E3C4EA6|nr:restriction endonuclease subunit S [Planococcus salinarum]TAA70636.1 restriction endonuclease subunit S [Planococcus salinarum]
MKLEDIANVKMGLVLSRKKAEMEDEEKVSYKLLTLKNITEEGVIQDLSFDQFASSDILDNHYFTEKGDVLMRLSHPNTAVYIDEEQSGLLIPSYFAVIKINQDDFLPEYLAWYLNSEEVKNELERSHAGSRIPSTNQNVLRNLPIARIPLSKQQILIEIWKLHLQEKNLFKQLLKEKEKWFKGVSDHILFGTLKEEAK